MWIKTYSNTYKNINLEQVWQIWADVNRYVDWHDDLDYCRLEGEFAVGNYFMLKPKGGPAFKVHITELVEENNGKYKRFADCTHFVGAKMYDIHEVYQTEDGVKISNTIKVTGLLRHLWVKLVAKNVANSAPKEMEALVTRVRKNNV